MNHYGNEPYRAPSALPPVVLWLLVANGVVFLLQNSFDGWLTQYFALWPMFTDEVHRFPWGMARVGDFQVWQLLTYGFLHGGFMHLFFNLFALWMFGSQVENLWGQRRFLVYYLACVIGAGLVQLAVTSIGYQHGMDPVPTVGASGGVFGILLAFGMMFPNRIIVLLIPPIPMKAKYFVLIYGAIELWAGFADTASGIAHFAHVGGMLFGFLLIQYWRGRWPFKPHAR